MDLNLKIFYWKGWSWESFMVQPIKFWVLCISTEFCLQTSQFFLKFISFFLVPHQMQLKATSSWFQYFTIRALPTLFSSLDPFSVFQITIVKPSVYLYMIQVAIFLVFYISFLAALPSSKASVPYFRYFVVFVIAAFQYLEWLKKMKSPRQITLKGENKRAQPPETYNI